MDAVTELAPQPHHSAEVIDLQAVREIRRRQEESVRRAPDDGSADPFPWAYTFRPPA